MTCIFALAFNTAHAAAPCAPRESLIGSAERVVANVYRASVVDSPDRRTAADYAIGQGESEETIKKRYAATGDLNCPNGMSQANVTIKNDIITTAAHSIFPGDRGCGDKNEATKCKFITEFEGKIETYEVEAMVATGYDCGMYDHQTGSDWAVLKLKKPVNSRIKPYRFDKNLSNGLAAGSPVMAVGKSADFPNDKVSIKDAPRHYGDCETKGSNNFDFNSIEKTTCDLGHRASGGGLFIRGADPVLLGVHESASEWTSKRRASERKKCPNLSKGKTAGPYDSNCWFTSTTMITGEFAAALEEIQARAGSSPSPRSTTPSTPASEPSGIDL